MKRPIERGPEWLLAKEPQQLILRSAGSLSPTETLVSKSAGLPLRPAAGATLRSYKGTCNKEQGLKYRKWQEPKDPPRHLPSALPLLPLQPMEGQGSRVVPAIQVLVICSKPSRPERFVLLAWSWPHFTADVQCATIALDALSLQLHRNAGIVIRLPGAGSFR